MPVRYTNRKGVTYMLYRGQTKTGKPRYYFGRPGQNQGEPVTQLSPGFTISESVNGVVSLVKDRPSLIQPEEVAALESAVQQHPEARRYRVAVKHDRVEIYERVGPDYDALLGETGPRRAIGGRGGAVRSLHAGVAFHPPRCGTTTLRRAADVLPGKYRWLVGTGADGIRGGIGPRAHSHSGHRAVL